MTITMTPTDSAAAFTRWLAKTRYAVTSQAVYVAKVNDFVRWCVDRAPEYDDMLLDPHVRDYAVRDYRRHLMLDRKQAVATVELALTALGMYFEFVGLGKPNVPRQSPPSREAKGLDEDDLRKVLRAAERRGIRDFALCSVLFLCAVRVSECAMLDVDDAFVSERMGTLHIRYGKGGKARDVDIPAQARAALRPWLAERRNRLGPDRVGDPLFLSRSNERLSVRSIQRIVADGGRAAGVDCSPHVLRHTFARRWVEAGNSLTELQEVLGHASLATTTIYARSGRAARREMAERVGIDL